jgi:hypothetical protein
MLSQKEMEGFSESHIRALPLLKRIAELAPYILRVFARLKFFFRLNSKSAALYDLIVLSLTELVEAYNSEDGN